MATKLTDPASIDLLISEMTVAEKARLVIGGSPWCTEELPEYGIPKLFMLDSCNGLNLMEYESEFVYRDLEKQATAAGTPLDREKNGYMGGLLLALGALHKKAAEQKAAGVPEKEKPYGIYPPGIAYGSTWDPELVKKTSAVMAREMASYFGVKEKLSCLDETTQKKAGTSDLGAGVRALLRTKYFYITVIVFISAFIINGIFLSSAVYFTRDVFGNADMYSLIAIISILVAVVVMAFAPKMFAKHGKRNVLLVFAVVGVVGGIIGFVGAKQLNPILVFVSTALHGASLAPYVAAIFTFASDIVEYLEQQLGQRYEGLVTSVSSIGSKVGTGLGSAILGWGLEMGGYDGALIQQAQSAKDAETFLLFIVPTLASVVCFIAMWFWDIDKKIKK